MAEEMIAGVVIFVIGCLVGFVVGGMVGAASEILASRNDKQKTVVAEERR